MAENPFNKLIEIMRKEGAKLNPPSIMLGEVIQPNPLIVKVGGIQIDKDNILIADYLLANYQRNISIPSASGSTSTVSTHSHSITSVSGAMTFTNTFSAGDTLAILPTEDRQQFIIICRVVSSP